MQTDEYCREIETYLCRKNDGHLIRVVGPAFDLVAHWATDGLPIKIVFAGIDHAFERYHRKGPRRRPLRIEFCEADVLDAFDDWRRAVGVAGLISNAAQPESGTAQPGPDPRRRRQSLPGHLERVVLKLTSARASGRLDASFDAVIDRAGHELDLARADQRGVRGEARRACIDRLTSLDHELVERALASLDGPTRDRIEVDAEEELAAFRSQMTAEAFSRARAAAIDRLVRDHLGLPRLTFTAEF